MHFDRSALRLGKHRNIHGGKAVGKAMGLHSPLPVELCACHQHVNLTTILSLHVIFEAPVKRMEDKCVK